MALKPDGKMWSIREQIFEDAVSGLSYQFEVTPDGECCLRVFGDILPFGNREFIFSATGEKTGAGTFQSSPRPSWVRPVA